jgi:serine/threonine-protein kinase
MAEDETKKSWWLTLPGIFTAIGTVIVAITGLIGALHQVGWLGSPSSSQDNTRVETTTSAIGPTETSGSYHSPADGGVRPAGTDEHGFLDSDARSDPGNPVAATGRTKQSLLVLCQTGPGAFYYRGVRRNGGDVITLTNAVRSSGGFDVTRYQIRPEGLTILMKDRQPVAEQWESQG